MKKNIPKAMATQHPDNATTPFWKSDPFINTREEIQEMHLNFRDLKVDEFMWDWEGKFADEALFERLFTEHLDYFKTHQIGQDIFITIRIPNIWEEKTYKLPRAFMSLISAGELCHSLNLHDQPIIEMILPMTKSADQLLFLQNAYSQFDDNYRQVFTNFTRKNPRHKPNIGIIPLFESVEDLLNCNQVLSEYLNQYQSQYQNLPNYLRVFIARSDPALNAGFLAATIASLAAIDNCTNLQNLTGIPIYPIIGSGSLPFRGGLNPEIINQSLELYSGAYTFTLQSAFRYDYDQTIVTEAIQKILNNNTKSHPINKIQAQSLIQALKFDYSQVIEPAAPLINQIVTSVPRRRERVQHIGLFGYSRGEGPVKLPRAIGFNSAWYSLGLPPEFIGLGRFLSKISITQLEDLLTPQKLNLIKQQLLQSIEYFNFDNLTLLAQHYPFLKPLIPDFEQTQKIFNLPTNPTTFNGQIHRHLTSIISLKHLNNQPFQAELVEAAIIRKSLG